MSDVTVAENNLSNEEWGTALKADPLAIYHQFVHDIPGAIQILRPVSCEGFREYKLADSPRRWGRWIIGFLLSIVAMSMSLLVGGAGEKDWFAAALIASSIMLVVSIVGLLSQTAKNREKVVDASWAQYVATIIPASWLVSNSGIQTNTEFQSHTLIWEYFSHVKRGEQFVKLWDYAVNESLFLKSQFDSDDDWQRFVAMIEAKLPHK